MPDQSFHQRSRSGYSGHSTRPNPSLLRCTKADTTQASISIAYRILYQITLRLSCLLNRRSTIALNKVSSWVKRQKLVMVALVIAWAFAFVFEVAVDLSIGKDIWHERRTRSFEIARLTASAFAL